MCLSPNTLLHVSASVSPLASLSACVPVSLRFPPILEQLWWSPTERPPVTELNDSCQHAPASQMFSHRTKPGFLSLHCAACPPASCFLFETCFDTDTWRQGPKWAGQGSCEVSLNGGQFSPNASRENRLISVQSKELSSVCPRAGVWVKWGMEGGGRKKRESLKRNENLVRPLLRGGNC